MELHEKATSIPGWIQRCIVLWEMWVLCFVCGLFAPSWCSVNVDCMRVDFKHREMYSSTNQGLGLKEYFSVQSVLTIFQIIA